MSSRKPDSHTSPRTVPGKPATHGDHEDVGFLTATGLSKSFDGAPVVDDVSFSIRRQEVFGLLGPNGAGKTTTIRMLSTVLAPDAGDVTIGGHSVLREADEHGWRIGAVYHSHPRGPARPSATDLAAGIDPDWMSFVIARNRAASWVIRAYRMADGQAIPLGKVSS